MLDDAAARRYDLQARGVYAAGHVPGATFLGFDWGGHLRVGHQEGALSRIERYMKAMVFPSQHTGRGLADPVN